MNAMIAPLGRYRKDVTLSVVGTVGEVVMEVFLPFIMAFIIDRGVMASNMGAILGYGALMLIMAVLSLGFGVLSSYFSASTASGYAAELRSSIFDKVQTHAFSNIDKFSTAAS